MASGPFRSHLPIPITFLDWVYNPLIANLSHCTICYMSTLMIWYMFNIRSTTIHIYNYIHIIWYTICELSSWFIWFTCKLMYLFRIGLSFRCDQLGLLFFFFLEAFYKALAREKVVVESQAVAQALSGTAPIWAFATNRRRLGFRGSQRWQRVTPIYMVQNG